MSNVLGSSQTAKVAPPPPPLPAGLSVSGAENKTQAKTAPPPPPLPAGLSVAGEEKKAPVKAAPPPPPLPAGLSNVNMMPPVSERPQPVEEAFAVKAPSFTNPSPTSGRMTMSLQDAEREKAEEEERIRLAEEEAAREAAKPKVLANGGKLDVEDPCFARSFSDGLYYFATIKSFDSENAVVVFFDGVEATLPFAKIYTVSEAKDAMECFANWSERGNYFPAVIEEQTKENQFSVFYKEDNNMKEVLPYYDVRFAIL